MILCMSDTYDLDYFVFPPVAKYRNKRQEEGESSVEGPKQAQESSVRI